MALLSGKLARAAALLSGIGVLGSCAQSAPLGHVEAWLRDDDASDGERVAAQAFIDPSVSRYAPHGLYAYAELPRADGSIGLLELDVPTDAPEGEALPRFTASYRELIGEHTRFASSAVRGQLVVPGELGTSGDVGCECEDSGFALVFSDRGATRRLSLGRIGWAEQFCRPRAELTVSDALRLTRERCPLAPLDRPEPPTEPAPTHTARTREPEPTPCTYGCYEYEEQPVIVAGGCAAEDDDDYTSSGCESETTSDSSDSSSSGSCEGDTLDDDDDNDGAASCTISRAAPRPKRHAHRSSAFAGTGLPLLSAALLQAVRARNLRARRRLLFASSTVPCQSPPELEQ